MRTWTLALVVWILACAARAGAAPAADPAPVIAAERAFAARAAVVGIAPSFLEFMADDAVVFAPEPVNAKALYGARPPPKPPKDGGTLLAWWPALAGIASSGDLGFTTGPATVNGKPGVYYFTVWRREPGGAWKWVLDGGVPGDQTAAPDPRSEPRILASGGAWPVDRARARKTLDRAEGDLARRAHTSVAAAYRAHLTADAQMQGSGLAPATNPVAVARELATRPASIAFRPLGGGLSQANDLAWTYGDARWKDGRGHYVRIWQRRTGHWALVFDQIIKVDS